VSRKYLLKHYAPYSGLKDERPTSNIEHRTLNIELKNKLPTPILDKVKFQTFFQIIFLFLHLFPFNVRCWMLFFSPSWQKQLNEKAGFTGVDVKPAFLFLTPCALPHAPGANVRGEHSSYAQAKKGYMLQLISGVVESFPVRWIFQSLSYIHIEKFSHRL
jgi:hypothetical protein